MDSVMSNETNFAHTASQGADDKMRSRITLRSKSWMLLTLLLAGAATGRADIWQVGDLTTYGGGSWGGCAANCGSSFPDPGAVLLDASFNTVYAATGGVIVGSASKF